MMIDTHCHLLNSVDDASKNTQYTTAMLYNAHQHGIKKILATPHCWPGIKYQNDYESLAKPFAEAQEIIRTNKLDIDLYLGSEVFISPDAMDWIRNKRAVTLNNTNRYLIELPWRVHGNTTVDVDETLQEIIALGYRVIIAHPERYGQVRDDFNALKRWRSYGCDFQVNRTSLLEEYNWEYETAIRIMDAGYADVIATDAHHYTGSRIMRLDDIYDWVQKRYDKDTAELLLNENPQRLIDGKDLAHQKRPM